MKFERIFKSILVMTFLFNLVSCGESKNKNSQPEIQIIQGETGPQGPSGPQGPQGPAGTPGENGQNGQNGENGLTPYIGANGNWWIGETDTGYQAVGHDGTNGIDGTNGNNGTNGVSIIQIIKIGSEGNVDTYRIIFSNGDFFEYKVTNGTEGIQGQPGTNGSSVISGYGIPTNNIGANGDAYIDLNTWNYYLKRNSAWEYCGNIKGEKGDQGISIVSAVINEEGELVITFSNNNVVNAGHVKDTREHTVNFYCGEELISSKKVKHGEKIESPSIHETNGYIINDWYILVGDTYKSWAFWGYVVTEDMNLYADFEYKTYTVKFIDNKFGNLIDDEIVTFKSAYSFIELTHEGYYHINFVDEDSNTYAKNGIWTTCSDITLYVNWEARNYSVSLNPNGGTVAVTSVSVVYDQNYQLPIPERANYIFVGWFDGENRISSNATWKFSSNKSLVARWTNVLNTYIFDPGDGICDVIYQTIGWEDSYSLPFPTLEGHIFKGWYIGENYIPQTGIWTYSNVGCTLIAKYYDGSIAKNYSFVFEEAKDGYKIQSSYKNFVNVIIPTFYNGKKVYRIDDNAFKNNTNLISIQLPLYIEEIGDSCFSGCTSLRDVINLENVLVLGNYAFRNCKSIEQIIINNLTSELACFEVFQHCESLKYVNIQGSYRYISNGCFAYCYLLETIILADSVKYLSSNDAGIGAFKDCSSLINFPILPNLTTIGVNTFLHCSSLQSIYLSNTVKYIKNDSFSGCASLEYIFYKGTSSEFNSIEFYGNPGLSIDKVYYYSSSKPSGSGKYWHFSNSIPTVWTN